MIFFELLGHFIFLRFFNRDVSTKMTFATKKIVSRSRFMVFSSSFEEYLSLQLFSEKKFVSIIFFLCFFIISKFIVSKVSFEKMFS